MSVNGRPVLFEADEEGNYRAVDNEKEMADQNGHKTGLLKEIAESIQFLVN